MYREVGGDEDSDAEEEDQNLLESVETRLLQFDPTFSEDQTLEGRQHAKNALINAFVRGGVEERYDPENMAHSHQLHLNVERIRVPETWFQPGMFGIDSAGLGEVAGWVLNGFEEEERRKMMQVSHVWYHGIDGVVRIHYRWMCKDPRPADQNEECLDSGAPFPSSAENRHFMGWR